MHGPPGSLPYSFSSKILSSSEPSLLPQFSSVLFRTLFIVLLRTRNTVVGSSQVKPNMYWTGSNGKGTQLP